MYDVNYLGNHIAIVASYIATVTIAILKDKKILQQD